MFLKWDGGCFCGAIRYEAKGDAGIVTHCHCLHCRRTSGAAFVTGVEFTRGTPRSFQSRPEVTRSFCPSCGTPQDHVFHDRRVPWVRLADGR